MDIKVTDDKVNFSITVSDNSSAPAKEILVYLKVMITFIIMIYDCSSDQIILVFIK